MPYNLKNNYDFRTIHVQRAVKAEDIEKAYFLRWSGYKRYFPDPMHVTDDLDLCDHAVLLLATRSDGTPLGTLRILDGRLGPIEVDILHVDCRKLLPPKRFPVAEAGRFSVPRCHDSRWIKLALWKAYYSYCIDNDVRTMLVTVRLNAGRDYKSLLFEHLGKVGEFSHRVLSHRMHETWVFDVPSGAERYKAARHPLFTFFCLEDHPNISYK